MSLIKNNSQDDFKLSNPEIYEANLNSKAKELKNKLETADIDLKKSSFSNLLIERTQLDRLASVIRSKSNSEVTSNLSSFPRILVCILKNSEFFYYLR